MNNCVLIGRICKEIELRYIPGTEKAVCTLNVAVDRKYKGKDGNKITDFFLCDCFGKTAEFAANYLSKGRLIAVQGEIHIDNYQDKEGNKKSITKISVSEIQALDKKEDKPKDSQSQNNPPGFDEIEDSIPF